MRNSLRLFDAHENARADCEKFGPAPGVRLRATSRPEQVQQTEQALLDHLIGANEQSGWHSQAERPSGLEVDNQLDFCGLLNRKIGGPLALENPADVYPEQTIRLREIGSVAHETAGDRKLAVRIYSWHCVVGSQIDKPTLGQKERFTAHHKRARPLTDKDLESQFERK